MNTRQGSPLLARMNLPLVCTLQKPQLHSVGAEGVLLEALADSSCRQGVNYTDFAEWQLDLDPKEVGEGYSLVGVPTLAGPIRLERCW